MKMPAHPATDVPWFADVPRSIRTQTVFGLVLALGVFGSFGTWAALAPLASAVIAPGSFVATGRNKIVQHLEGGIIAAILVNEGDRVVEGQELVRLDGTASHANARQLLLRQLRLEAILARLQAEAQSAESYQPPAGVTAAMADPEVRAINKSQQDSFRSARLKVANQIRLLEQNIAALEFQHGGLTAQTTSMQRQRVLLAEEFKTKASLLASGIVTRSAVSAVERAVADADGDISRLQAETKIALSQMSKFRMEIVQTRDAMSQVAIDEMQNIEAELDAVREQIRSADNVLGRTTIVAPASGVVVRIHYHTAGGVIESGKPILEILPLDVPLIIETQIPRMQIDEVRAGQHAAVRLSALNQRTTPVLEGEVIYVSADSIQAGATGEQGNIYLARVSVSAAELARVAGFTPTPGMPAEILIQTHERTFFEYLMKPIVDSMARSFRED
jgi:HlyD family type I secretion membrane fusion protein